MSEATETLARSRSSLDTKPLVRPLASATSAMLLRAASRAAFSCAPMRGPSWPPGRVPFSPLALIIELPPPSWRVFRIRSHYDTRRSIHETRVDSQETFDDYG